MKFIQKQSEPKTFSEWKDSYKEFGGTPVYADLRSDLKNVLKQSMIDEQGKICAYCGIRVHLQNTHIEHLKPQSKYPEDQVTYENLVASCEGENRLVHCGHNKENWYEEDKFVSPLRDDCESFFTYTFDGRIKPRSGDRVKEEMSHITISKLGLDTKKLNALRSAAIEGILLMEELDVDAIDAFLLQCQTPNENGELLPFAATLQQILRLEKEQMTHTDQM